MMWEVLYIGNMQFPKIEAGQNQLNYLGINSVAFWLTQGGQWRLFKASENKCQSLSKMWSLFLLCQKTMELTQVIWKNYFFQTIGKMYVLQVLSFVLE